MKREQHRRHSGASKVFVAVLCLVLAWHFVATYAWNAAPNAVRAVIGQQTLQSYMIPMFGQSWSVFAPNPGSVNQDLQVRAIVRQPDAGTKTTDWVSLTTHSMHEGILHHPVPSRLYLNDFILADRYYAAFMAVDEKVRDIAGKSYLQDGWSQQLKADLLEALGQDVNAPVNDYIGYESAVNALTSAVARAHWGDDVIEVQTRVLKTPVVPFAQRGQNVQMTTNYFVGGWRAPTSPADLDPTVFDRWYGGKGATR